MAGFHNLWSLSEALPSSFFCHLSYPSNKLQESDKGQIFYWSIQTCSRIRLLFNWSIVTMLKKPQNCPISDFFDLTPKYFLLLLLYTNLVPPSTDPVPSYINQCHSILTQYHQVSTSTNLYCCCLAIAHSCTVYPGSCSFFFSLKGVFFYIWVFFKSKQLSQITFRDPCLRRWENAADFWLSSSFAGKPSFRGTE